MSSKNPVNWMLAEAVDSLAWAERLHQQFFSLRPSADSRKPSWKPPIDVLETDREILILVALPGVDPDRVEAVIDSGTLIISGHRVLPVELRNARIHRLELPQGRFERRIVLPTGRYAVSRFAVNRCVALRLSKFRREFTSGRGGEVRSAPAATFREFVDVSHRTQSFGSTASTGSGQ